MDDKKAKHERPKLIVTCQACGRQVEYQNRDSLRCTCEAYLRALQAENDDYE